MRKGAGSGLSSARSAGEALLTGKVEGALVAGAWAWRYVS